MTTADKIAELIRHGHGDVINGLLEILQDQQEELAILHDAMASWAAQTRGIQRQIDAMKDRTTQCDCCGGYNGEHYPNCPAWARTGGDKPEQEQQGEWDYDCDALWFNGVNHIDAGTHALNAAGITPDTSPDELAAMARLGKMRARGLELTTLFFDDEFHGTTQQMEKFAWDASEWMRELLLGEGDE